MMSRAFFFTAAAIYTGTVNVLAQDECTASGALAAAGGETFDFCTGVLDMEIFWNYRPDDVIPNVDVLVESENDGWHAFGFSSGSDGASMAPSNVVMACFDGTVDANGDADLADYNIAGRVTPQQATNQGLVNFTQVLSGDCTFRFTRPITPDDIDDIGQHLLDRDQRTIVARGGDALAQHASTARIAFDVNFLSGENNDASSVHVASATFITATIGAIFSLLL